MSAVGAGAVVGAIGLTVLRRDRPSVTALAGTAALLCAGVLGLSAVGTIGPAAAVLTASPTFAPQVAKILAPLRYLTVEQVEAALHPVATR